MASLYIIIGGFFWGIIGLFSSNLAAAGCSPVEITFLRNLVGALGMLCYLVFFKRESLKINMKDLWMFLGTGILSIVFFNIMYFQTISLTTLSVAAILLYTAPCFVMLMSVVFFHEKLTGRKMIALLLAFCGCACTTGILDGFFMQGFSGPGNLQGAGSFQSLGILTGIASGFGYALYSIFGNVALKKYRSETVTVYTFIIAAVFLAPFCMRPALLEKMRDGYAMVNALAIGLVSTMLPFLFYTAGLKKTEPGKASVMAFVEPMVATLVGVFILRQPLSLIGGLGIGLIFLSILILNLKGKREKSMEM